MAENTDDTTVVEEQDERMTEEDLRGIFSDEIKKELDERGFTGEVLEKLGGVTDLIDGLFEKHKPGDNTEGLLERIGTMIDEKLAALASGKPAPKAEGEENGKAKREPRLKIFT